MSIDWLQPEARVRGSVVVVGGRGERAGVYVRFARRIAFDGYRVTVVTSGVLLDAINAIDDAVADLPVVVIGSDSGALTALTVAAQSGRVAGVVAAGLLVKSVGDVPLGWEAELEIRSACPVHRGVLDAADSLERGALAGDVEVATPDVFAETVVPTLIIHGTDDAVSPAGTVQELAAALVAARVVLVDGGRHDILNDVSHRSVAAEIVQFLERLRLPGARDIVLRAPVGVLAG